MRPIARAPSSGVRSLLVLALTACGNNLPGPGTCAAPPGNGAPELVEVPLLGRGGYDDLRYAPQLGKVIAAPEGTGQLFLVDPDTLASQPVQVPAGVASADASATTVYAADRGNDRIVAIDAATLQQVATGGTDGNPDYVRVSPTAPEVWVTLPGRDQIEILDATSLQVIDRVDVPVAPEGLTFDTMGRAYTHDAASGKVVVIDAARRLVLDELDTGCGTSHGFPQVDRAYDLIIGGCRSSGGAGIVTGGGDLVSGIEAGGDSAILAYDDTRHHLYLRGDPGDTLDIIAVCSSGGLTVLAQVPIAHNGHGATVDDKGHVWVCNANTGGLQRITDPFGGT